MLSMLLLTACFQSNDNILFEQVSSNVGSLPYASSGIQTRDISNSETQNASQVAETSASYDAIEVNCNVSNPDTPVVEIRDQIPQLRCSESNSSLFSPHLPSLIPMEISIGGQTNQIYQDPWQLVADHVELSNVLQPLHSTVVSAVAEPVRQASETRTASVPPVSSNLPSQTAPGGSSQMPLPMYRDPLQIEMERIYKEKNQAITGHEETVRVLYFFACLLGMIKDLLSDVNFLSLDRSCG